MFPKLSVNHSNAFMNSTDALKSSKQESASLPSMSLQSDHSGRCSRQISTSSSSSSTIVTVSTDLCFRISRRVAPSPPPMIATRFGSGWANIPGWTSASWYAASPYRLLCSTPSRWRTLFSGRDIPRPSSDEDPRLGG